MFFTKALEAVFPTPRGSWRVRLASRITNGVALALIGLTVTAWAVNAQVVGSATMNVARASHSATRLQDGTVLIAGGENAGGALNSAEIYSPATQLFSLTGSLVSARTEHTATLLADGRVLISGGLHGGTPLDSTEIFDPVAGSFGAGPSMTQARSGHTATALSDGRILVVGGNAGGSAEIFNPSSMNFTALSGSLATPRWFAGTALLQDGTVLIAGGADFSGSVLKSVEVFNPATSSFTTLDSPLQVPREKPLLRMLPDGKVLIMGGNDDSTIELFDPAVPIIRAYARVLNDSNALSDILRSRTRAALIHPIDPNDAQLQSQLTPEISCAPRPDGPLRHRDARLEPGPRRRRRQQQRPVPELGEGGQQLEGDYHDGQVRLRSRFDGRHLRHELAAGRDGRDHRPRGAVGVSRLHVLDGRRPPGRLHQHVVLADRRTTSAARSR